MAFWTVSVAALLLLVAAESRAEVRTTSSLAVKSNLTVRSEKKNISISLCCHDKIFHKRRFFLSDAVCDSRTEVQPKREIFFAIFYSRYQEIQPILIPKKPSHYFPSPR